MDVDLRTFAGIALATLTLVQGLKLSIAGTWADRLPIFLWVLLVSSGLTLLAVWAGFINEPFKAAFANAVLAALTASGSWDWATGRTINTFDGTPAVPPRNSTSKVLLLGLLFIPFFGTGCAGTTPPREKAFNVGIKALWTEIKADWVPRVEQAIDLSPEGKALRVGPKDSLASEFDDLIATHEKAMATDGNQPH